MIKFLLINTNSLNRMIIGRVEEHNKLKIKGELIMKLVGICKIFKLEEVSEKRAKGQIYFSTKRGEDEEGNAEFETSFINARVVGKAKKQLDELASVMDVEKLKIDITESSLKSVSYQNKQKQWKTYTEVVIFDFDIPKETKDEPKQNKKSYRK